MHTQHKKLFSLLALALLVASLFTLPAAALDVEPPADPIDPIEPYINIDSFTATISISSSGYATCGSSVSTKNSSYYVSLTMTLQKYYSGGWHDVKTWSTSGTGGAFLSKSRYVTSGYYYRTKATAYVTTSGGSYVESPSAYSASVYY